MRVDEPTKPGYAPVGAPPFGAIVWNPIAVMRPLLQVLVLCRSAGLRRDCLEPHRGPGTAPTGYG